MKKAVVLLSGGLDSATALGMAIDRGLIVYPISFHYSQRHIVEVDSAMSVVAHYRYQRPGNGVNLNVERLHVVKIEGLTLDSALTDDAVNVPMRRKEAEMKDIPVTYVPARNSMFLAIATGYAESVGADEVWCGFNAVDYSGYPDCRPKFVHAMQEALALGTKRGVDGQPIVLKAPLIHLKKSEIVQHAIQLGVPMELTWSCYIGGKRPCGECDSCLIRAKGFAEAGYADPALGE